ncbi:MAG TPA: hypothetical protein EYP73_05945, partial [Acidimicrobiia bacterium]|nr:hypothetical protein [Acidimicrobiia bacterium]
MTKTQDNRGAGTLEPKAPDTGEQLESLVQEPLWRIRLRLLRRTARSNWKLFRQSRVGMIGLVIIGIFGLMAIIQPILLFTGIWPVSVYDPVVGN